MSKESKACTVCPHCDVPLSKTDMPMELAWEVPYQLVCFNDDCSYFIEGWDWMLQHYNAKSSYRFRVNPGCDKCEPLMVWSKDAIKDHIIDDQEDKNEKQ